MKFYRVFTFIFTSVATGLAAAFILLLLMPELFQQLPQQPPTAPPRPVQPGPASYADAVAMAAPSVVNIYATKLTQEGPPAVFEDPFFQRFFGSETSKPRIRREQSLGSGVIVDTNGHVLTNNHVIEGASEVAVVLGNGRQLTSLLIGTDPDTDLAVLQVTEAGLPVANLGRSADLRVGDVVLAIGNPFGVGKTVTMGIVSATGRNQLGLANFENFIQTDAAINPGNSGGALINANGEVVGINTAIFARSGGAQGIGFAIPTDLAQAVMAEIVKNGRVIRGWLGVSGYDLNPQLAESMGLATDKGVLVAAIRRQGPAHLAGIVPGDVIQQMNGKETDSAMELMNRIAGTAPGTEIKLQILRGDEQLDLTAKVEERPRNNPTP